MAKRYFWLKLKEDFFRQKEIKKLRKIAGGDTFTIIYLKLQLLSLQDNGKIFFEGVEDTLFEELALEIDEDVNNVELTIAYLMKHGLLEEVTHDEYILPQTVASIGSESDSAERMRKSRVKKRLSQCDNVVQIGCTEQEQDIEQEQEIDIEQEQQLYKDIWEILKEHYNTKEISAIHKFCVENNVAAAVVKEKFLVVRTRKSIRNKVGALINAIQTDWNNSKMIGTVGDNYINQAKGNYTSNNSKRHKENTNSSYNHNDIESEILKFQEGL